MYALAIRMHRFCIRRFNQSQIENIPPKKVIWLLTCTMEGGLRWLCLR